MTTALVIETSSAYCSLALHVDGKDFVVHKLLQRQHNQFLLSLLDELFAQAQILPTQVEVIGFGCGPGVDIKMPCCKPGAPDKIAFLLVLEQCDGPQ